MIGVFVEYQRAHAKGVSDYLLQLRLLWESWSGESTVEDG
jgi:hypothetical protein